MTKPITRTPESRYRVEFWVLRVILHPGPRRHPVHLNHMDAAAKVTTLALLAIGKLCTLPSGCICEPVEVFDNEVDAHAYRERLATKHPDEDFRVILSTDGGT